jgi:hypothetical protein
VWLVARGDDTLEVDGLTFVWSGTKAATNRRKHGVTFERGRDNFR